MDVLIVGRGGREHALAWKLAQSPRLGRLYAAPGNAGIGALGECLPIPAESIDEIAAIAREKRIGLVVVGPEAPLAAGLADRLEQAGVPVFGPSAAAARIESSKAYARKLMSHARVSQPRHATFRDLGAAAGYLEALEAEGARGAVVKASGLAAGKGAVVCDDIAAARAAARAMLVHDVFGEAGAEIVIEERLEGEEVSLFVLTDGEEVLPLLTAQDYKRIGDGDRGPNTGGMGSCAPAPALSAAAQREALDNIVRPTLAALAAGGAPFRGCLYAGLMRTDAGLKVIEFNCRFGDPETQAVLPLLESDLLELLLACAERRLAGQAARWKPGCAVSVVLASGGYPGSYVTGKEIRGLDEASGLDGVTVFHAGAARRDGRTVTSGGRVLNVTGIGGSFAEARNRAYAGVELIRFEGMHYRSDIGLRMTNDQ